MKVVDLEKLDWRQDPDYLAAERKMARLVDRETQDRVRRAELEMRARDLEPSLRQARAAALLDEASGERTQELLKELKMCQTEITEIREGLDALKLAKEKHGPAVQDAASKAKIRLAEKLIGPYVRSAQTLREQLDQAVETNRLLDAIHRLVTKECLTHELHGLPEMKPLTLSAAWDILSTVNGARHNAFDYWIAQHDKLFSTR